MKTKIQNALKEMSAMVVFDPKKHTYKIEKTGEWIQGVSSVSSIVPKDWLSAWGAKEAVKALGYSDYEGDTKVAKEVLTKISQMKTPEEWIAFLKEAKGASARKSKTALVDGKAGHLWLEDYVKAKIDGIEIPKTPEGSLERPIKQFLEWEKAEVDYWIASEALVAYPAKGYAGTLDAIAMLKSGKLAIVDFKFASHISEDYFLQTAGYGGAFDQFGIKFDERVIIRLPKTLEKEEWNEKEHKYYMVPNNIEVEYVKTDYETDKEVFFHCLYVKKWINIVSKK